MGVGLAVRQQNYRGDPVHVNDMLDMIQQIGVTQVGHRNSLTC